MPAPPSTRTIGLLAYDDMQALDLAGPLDVFGAANELAASTKTYDLRVIGLDKRAARAENGLEVVPAHALEDAPPMDTLLIPGGAGAREGINRDARLLAWLRGRALHTRRMVSVCTGIYVLAVAGLLDGRRVTTHWRFADDLARRHAAVRVEPDRLFLRDGRFATSGGLTAGMDLALALVEEDLGAPVALAVARQLVMYMKRPGNQAQFSAPLAAQTRANGRMGALMEWLLAHLGGDISIERMASEAAMSPRNFRRVFAVTFNATPARFFVLHVTTHGASPAFAVDIPAQDVRQSPVTIKQEGKDVTLAIPIAGHPARFAGHMNADGDAVTGSFTQDGESFPLVLTKQPTRNLPGD